MHTADLVERVYEAGLDPKAWVECVQELEAALGGVVALSLRHPTAGDPGLIVAPSLQPEAVRSYQDHYFALDPLKPHQDSAPVGRVAFARGPAERKLRGSRFFREWMEPQDLLPSLPLLGVVDRDEGVGASLITVFRSQDPGRPGPADRRSCAQLMPHLRRAVRIHFRTAAIEEKMRTLANAVDRIPIGLILVDGRRHVRATNRAAERILSTRDGLALNREGLHSPGDSEATEKIQRLIAGATFSYPQVDAVPFGALSLSRGSGRRPLQILVARIGSSSGGEAGATAAVFVCDSDQALAPQPGLLRRLFDLTPAEAGLARELANGSTLEQAARELRIATGTARQRLQQIFAKTQTGRQSELVRLLLSGPAQLLPED